MYAYLRVVTIDCDRVSFSDGTERFVERGAGEGVAADWRSAQAKSAHPNDIARLEARARARVAARNEALRVHEAKLAEWQEQLDRALDRALSVTHMRNIHADFLKQHAEPVIDPKWGDSEPADVADALQIPVPKVTAERRWMASLAEVNDRDYVLGPAGPYPHAAVARVLSELERQGWSVVHVSENRTVRHDDAVAQAHTIGAWILLHSATDRAQEPHGRTAA
jgi:hypothetical protein